MSLPPLSRRPPLQLQQAARTPEAEWFERARVLTRVYTSANVEELRSLCANLAIERWQLTSGTLLTRIRRVLDEGTAPRDFPTLQQAIVTHLTTQLGEEVLLSPPPAGRAETPASLRRLTTNSPVEGFPRSQRALTPTE